MKVRLDDNVLVTTGKDKGKKGRITKILRGQNKIVVEKVNLKTKYTKKRQDRPGEKIIFEAPIDASNIMIICPNCNKPARAGYKKLGSGKKQRICKKCKESIENSKRSGAR